MYKLRKKVYLYIFHSFYIFRCIEAYYDKDANEFAIWQYNYMQISIEKA